MVWSRLSIPGFFVSQYPSDFSYVATYCTVLKTATNYSDVSFVAPFGHKQNICAINYVVRSKKKHKPIVPDLCFSLAKKLLCLRSQIGGHLHLAVDLLITQSIDELFHIASDLVSLTGPIEPVALRLFKKGSMLKWKPLYFRPRIVERPPTIEALTTHNLFYPLIPLEDHVRFDPRFQMWLGLMPMIWKTNFQFRPRRHIIRVQFVVRWWPAWTTHQEYLGHPTMHRRLSK